MSLASGKICRLSALAMDDEEAIIADGCQQDGALPVDRCSRPKVNAALVALEEVGAIIKNQGKIICNIIHLKRCAGLEAAEDA